MVFTCDRNNKGMYNGFYESKESLGCFMEREEKAEDRGNVYFKSLAKTFLLAYKCCSWPTFYQMDFIKR